MTRTRPVVLVVVALLGVGAGFLIDQLLTVSGRSTFAPPLALPFLLAGLGVAVVALAIPVRRATRADARGPVNPFRALRIAVLAKASSILGAAVGGVAAGMLLFLITRPVVPSLGSMGTVIGTLAVSAALVAAALVAENLCTIRKDDDDDDGPGGPAPAH